MRSIYYLLNGFKLIFLPGIKRYVVIPLILNLALFSVLFLLAQHYFVKINHFIMGFLPTWLHWLNAILWLFFFLSFFIIFLYTFVTIANIVAAPFNSILAEKVEAYLTGKTFEDQSLLTVIRDLPRSIKRQLAILGYYIPRAMLLLILFFIPIVQLAAGLMWFLFNAWIIAIQFIDYPTDNRRIPLTQVFDVLKKHRMATLSFGMGTLLLSMIPIVNCLAMSAAVAGATAFWIEELQLKLRKS